MKLKNGTTMDEELIDQVLKTVESEQVFIDKFYF